MPEHSQRLGQLTGGQERSWKHIRKLERTSCSSSTLVATNEEERIHYIAEPDVGHGPRGDRYRSCFVLIITLRVLEPSSAHALFHPASRDKAPVEHLKHCVGRS